MIIKGEFQRNPECCVIYGHSKFIERKHFCKYICICTHALMYTYKPTLCIYIPCICCNTYIDFSKMVLIQWQLVISKCFLLQKGRKLFAFRRVTFFPRVNYIWASCMYKYRYICKICVHRKPHMHKPAYTVIINWSPISIHSFIHIFISV